MRVNPDLYSSVNASIQQSEATLQTAIAQLSSGKRVSTPSDDPTAFAGDLKSLASSASVDRYTKNASAVTTQAQMADSALSSVVTSLTRALSLGTEGGDATLTSDQRAALAQQVQGVFADVLAQANTTDNGVAIFAGTADTTTPFTTDTSSSAGYTYQGNDGTNQAAVGNEFNVQVNVPGDQIFASSDGNVLGSLQQLATALTSGSSADLGTATAAVSSAISHVGQIRAIYASTVQQLNTQSDYLSQETLSLSSQQSSLTDVDTATAATNMTQAQTALSAVYAAAAKVLPDSLLNYLQN